MFDSHAGFRHSGSWSLVKKTEFDKNQGSSFLLQTTPIELAR